MFDLLSATSNRAPPRTRLAGPGICGGAVFIPLAMLLGCASNPSAPATSPLTVDPEVVAEDALEATLPGDPVQIGFGFRLREADLRFQGRGVARIQPPYRVRLDLFTGGGETFFQAALVGSDLRMPVWAPRALAPPPALLWAALGVFRPDVDLTLTGGREAEGGVVTLRYVRDDQEELRFRFSRGRLARAEIRRKGNLEEEVDLSYDEASGNVVETVYRNQAHFLELIFSLESVENVEAFPPDIWHPGG